ncbi:MAG: GNAT family N-acetyltransferase [Acidobacteriota bacterium]|nr:GNAT family N-acetyltransferase [Acidobacteriota bacterium]
MPADWRIRLANSRDIDTLVAFTLSEAREAEGKTLDAVAARRGVEGGFADPPRATYWVAEASDGAVVAATSIVTEWSNFGGAWYWWVQSLFVVPEHRGTGLVQHLLDHLADAAQAAGALDLRLYARRDNERALRAYRRCRFVESPSLILTRALGARTGQ